MSPNEIRLPMIPQRVDEDEQKFLMFKRSWEETLHGVVSKKLFDYKQFLSAADDEFGSGWQRIVFGAQATCPDPERESAVARMLWDNYAKRAAVVALDRRRCTTANEMRKKFMGE